MTKDKNSILISDPFLSFCSAWFGTFEELRDSVEAIRKELEAIGDPTLADYYVLLNAYDVADYSLYNSSRSGLVQHIRINPDRLGLFVGWIPEYDSIVYYFYKCQDLRIDKD